MQQWSTFYLHQLCATGATTVCSVLCTFMLVVLVWFLTSAFGFANTCNKSQLKGHQSFVRRVVVVRACNLVGRSPPQNLRSDYQPENRGVLRNRKKLPCISPCEVNVCLETDCKSWVILWLLTQHVRAERLWCLRPSQPLTWTLLVLNTLARSCVASSHVMQAPSTPKSLSWNSGTMQRHGQAWLLWSACEASATASKAGPSSTYMPAYHPWYTNTQRWPGLWVLTHL